MADLMGNLFLMVVIFGPPILLLALGGCFIRSRLRQRSEAAQVSGGIRLRNPPPPIIRYFTLYRNIGMLFESRRDYVPVHDDQQSSVALEPQTQPPRWQDERSNPSHPSSQRTAAQDPGTVV